MRRSRILHAPVLLTATLAAALALAGAPALAHAAPAVPAAPAAPPAPAADPVITPASARPAVAPATAGQPSGAPAAREVPSLRTESSSTVEVPGTGYRTTVSQVPVHYRDAAGAWQPIDTTLVRDGDTWRPKAAGWTASLPATLGATPVTVRSGARWVSLTPTGAAAVTGTVKGSRITYAEVFPGVSLVYDVLPTGLKESVVLARPGTRTSFGFALRAAPGLTAATKDGAVRITDAAGAAAFTLPAGYVADGTPDLSGHDAVATRLSAATALTAGTGAGLTLDVAPSWLSAPGRTWPVVLDPSVDIEDTQVTDCHMADGTRANTSYCNSDLIEFGYGGSTTGGIKRRAMLKFDLAAIPRSAVVKVADLQLTQKGNGQPVTTFTAQAMRMGAAWTTAATWNNSGTVGWTGGAFTPTPIDKRSVAAKTNPPAGDVTHFHIPFITQEWVQRSSANHGVLLQSSDEAAVGYAAFASSSYAVADDRPKLSVDWAVQMGQRDTNTFVDRKLTDRCTAGANVANGNLLVRCAEFSIAGVGQPVTISRYYNSGNGAVFRNRADSPLGINRWQLSTGIYLVVRGNAMEFYDGSGALHPFHQLGGTSFRQAPGLGASLEKDQPTAGQYRLKFHKSGAQYLFRRTNTQFYNATWQIWKIIDRNGNTTEFTYTDRPGFAEGALETIKDTRGRVIRAGYVFDAGSGKDFLRTLTDSAGRVATFAYSGWSLSAVTDTDNRTTQYAYRDFGTSAQQLQQFTDPRGISTQFTYDTDGRVKTITQHPAAGQDAVTSFEYNDTVSPPTTTVKDARTNATVYEIEHKDYASRVTKTIDAKGKTRSRKYTSNAQVAEESTPEFGAVVNTWGENPAIAGDASSGESLTRSVSQTGATTQRQYRPTGGSLCATAPQSGSGYDALCSRDDAGNQSTYAYDGPGNRQESTNAVAATSKVERAVNGSQWTPTDGRVMRATDPLTRVTTYGYLDVTFNGVTTKRLSTITPPTGSGLGVRQVSYDGLDRLRTYKNGRTTTATRDYDGADRLKKVSYDDGTLPVTYTYDGNGNTTQRVDAGGTTTFEYDGMNRPTRKTLPGGKVLDYRYDAVGNLLGAKQDGVETTYEYDNRNQVVTMNGRGGVVTRFAYREDGKRTDTWFNANAASPPTTWAAHTHTEITKSGRVSRIWTSVASSDTNRVHDNSYCYRPYTTGACDTNNANDRSKIQWQKDMLAGGATVSFRYDGAGRMIERKNVTTGAVSTTGYDKSGNRRSELEATRAARYYGYDAGNQVCWSGPVDGSTCTAPSQASTAYDNDPAGNQLETPDLTSLEYNGTDQTTRVTAASGTVTPFGYAADNQTERTSKGGTTYVNGLLGLQSESTSLQTTYYDRDPSGSLVSETLPGTGTGRTLFYVYEHNGTVRALVDETGAHRVSYAYSAWGEDRGITVPGGGAAPANPFRFAGQYLDSSTGLYKMGLRYYDPKQARWTQQDVIENLGDPSNGNRFAYAGDDPVNNVDPSGAAWWEGVLPETQGYDDTFAAASYVAGAASVATGAMGLAPVSLALGAAAVGFDVASSIAGDDTWQQTTAIGITGYLTFGIGSAASIGVRRAAETAVGYGTFAGGLFANDAIGN